MAARRAGYSQAIFLAPDYAVLDGIATIPNWSHLAAAFAPFQSAPLLIAPAAILSENDWLERLARTRIEPAAWAVAPHGIERSNGQNWDMSQFAEHPVASQF